MAARAGKRSLPLRLWEALPVNASDRASATKAAALIERSGPNQFDGRFGTDLLDTLEKVNKNYSGWIIYAGRRATSMTSLPPTLCVPSR